MSYICRESLHVLLARLGETSCEIFGRQAFDRRRSSQDKREP